MMLHTLRPGLGCTPWGSYSQKGVLLPSKCLPESPFLETLLRTLLRTLPPSKPHCKTPSKKAFLEPSRKRSREPFQEPFLEGVLSHDPLWCAPYYLTLRCEELYCKSGVLTTGGPRALRGLGLGSGLQKVSRVSSRVSPKV